MSTEAAADRGAGIAVIGAGILGVRTARELLTPGPDGRPGAARVALSTARRDRQQELGASFGTEVQVSCSSDPAPDAGADVAVAIVAREAGHQLDAVRAVVDRGQHVVATSDDPDEVAEILGLAERARRRGVRIVVGATMSPGLSCLLAAHAASLLDRVDEVHVARHGAAGPACARQRLRALRGTASEWRDGSWARRPGFSGRELDWFPDPVGGRDCYRAELAEPLLLHRCFPTAQRITARLAATRRDRALAPFPVLVPPPVEGGLGAIRVELRGERGGERSSVVYGALDRPAVAGAAVAAVTALHLANHDVEPGAGGVAELGDVVGLLRELARRGVRAATFEGNVGADARSAGA
jgi:hypothetical protein